MRIYIKQADGSFSFVYDDKNKEKESKIYLTPNKKDLQTSAHLEFFSKKLTRYIPYVSYSLESSDLKEPFLNQIELSFRGVEQNLEISVRDQKTGKEFPLRPLDFSEMEAIPLPDSAIALSSQEDSPLSKEEIEADLELLEKMPEVEESDIDSLFEASLSSGSDIEEDFSTEFLQYYDQKEAEAGLGELLAELERNAVKGDDEQAEVPEFLDDLDLSAPLEELETAQQEDLENASDEDLSFLGDFDEEGGVEEENLEPFNLEDETLPSFADFGFDEEEEKAPSENPLDVFDDFESAANTEDSVEAFEATDLNNDLPETEETFEAFDLPEQEADGFESIESFAGEEAPESDDFLDAFAFSESDEEAAASFDSLESKEEEELTESFAFDESKSIDEELSKQDSQDDLFLQEKHLLKKRAREDKEDKKKRIKQERLQEKTYQKDLKAKQKLERKRLPKSIIPGVIVLSLLGAISLTAFFLIKYLL